MVRRERRRATRRELGQRAAAAAGRPLRADARRMEERRDLVHDAGLRPQQRDERDGSRRHAQHRRRLAAQRAAEQRRDGGRVEEIENVAVLAHEAVLPGEENHDGREHRRRGLALAHRERGRARAARRRPRARPRPPAAARRAPCRRSSRPRSRRRRASTRQRRRREPERGRQPEREGAQSRRRSAPRAGAGAVRARPRPPTPRAGGERVDAQRVLREQADGADRADDEPDVRRRGGNRPARTSSATTPRSAA